MKFCVPLLKASDEYRSIENVMMGYVNHICAGKIQLFFLTQVALQSNQKLVCHREILQYVL